MKHRRFSLPTLELALAGFALAAAAAAGALVRALRTPEPVAVVAETIAVPSMVQARSSDPLAPYVTLADDPFYPSRTPPATRYRLADAMAKSATSWMDDMRGPAVLGTVVGAHDSSFAIVSLDGGPPKTVRVGERIGDYRAETIERGRVVFRDANGQQLARSANTPTRPRFPRVPYDPNNPNGFTPTMGFPPTANWGSDVSSPVPSGVGDANMVEVNPGRE